MTRNHEVEARQLLIPKEKEVPELVRSAISFAATRGIWYNLSRNRTCKSCFEAAQARTRLGKIGIPIWDEVKSGVYKYNTSAQKTQLLAIHCRADRKINFDFLKAFLAISEEPVRLNEEELSEHFSMKYGLVNPFSDLLAANAFHIFDEDLLRPVGVPGTSMTNAGDHTWGIEFSPTQLMSVLPLTDTARVTDPDPSALRRDWGVRKAKPIAIVTGNGPESGMLLWQMINHEIRTHMGETFAGDISMPSVTTFSIPEMGLSMELENRQESIWEAISNVVTRACVGGAQIIALACNTTQYYHKRIQELCNHWNATFISIPKAVEKFLLSQGCLRLSLAGIGSVVDIKGEWSAFSEINKISLFPIPKHDIALIEKLAFDIKRSKSVGTNAQKLRQILTKDNPALPKSKKTIPILIALTELSLILRESGIWKKQYEASMKIDGRQVFDTLPIYAKAIATEYFYTQA